MIKKKIFCILFNLICCLCVILTIFVYSTTKNDFKKFEFDSTGINSSNIHTLNNRIKENLNISSDLYIENDLTIDLSNRQIKDVNINFKYIEKDKFYSCTIRKENNYKIYEEPSKDKAISNVKLSNMLEVIEASYSLLNNIVCVKGYSCDTSNCGVIGQDYFYNNKELKKIDNRMYGTFYRISLINSNFEAIQVYYNA